MTDSERRHDVFSHPSPIEHWRHLVEIIALLIAAAWGFYVFVYQERIKPANEEPALDVHLSLSHEPMQRGKELVKLAVIEKNIGSTDLELNAEILNVYGKRFTNNPQDVHVREPDLAYDSHTLQAQTTSLLWTAELVWPRNNENLFAPGREKVRDLRLPDGLDFAIRAGSFDEVTVEYAYCYSKSQDFTFHAVRGKDGAFATSSLVEMNNTARGLRCADVKVSGAV